MLNRPARFVAAAVAAASLAVLACCGGKPAEQPAADNTTAGPTAGTVTIEFWHYFTREHERALKDMIAAFEKDNPGIKVRPVFQGNPQQLSQKLSSALAATPPNNPALSTVYENWTSDYVAKGYMDPVENYFDGPDPFPREDQEDIVRVFRQANEYDGKWVTMPFNKSIYVLYYNADMLAQAGFTTAPSTLEEFGEVVRKTTVREGARTRVFGLGTMPSSEAFTTLLFALGGELIGPDGRAAFNSPEGLRALTFIRDLQYPDKHIYVSAEYMSTPLGNGQIAAFIYSSASFPFVEKAVGEQFRWEIAPVPGDPAKEPRYVMQGTNVGIFQNRPEAERRAAWKLLRYLLQTDQCVEWATRSGYMPVRYSMLDHPKMKEYLEKQPRYALASSLVLKDLGKQEPKVVPWEIVRSDLSTMVDRVISTGADPAAELAAAEKKANDRLAAGK
jgi:multiple sugar transport system substrate-binding protein